MPSTSDLAIGVLRWVEYAGLIYLIGVFVVRRLGANTPRIAWARPPMELALGAALVELAYAGRAGTRWGLPTYWAGEMLLYGAAGWAATRRGTREGALFALVLALGTATFLLKVGYSPVRLTVQ